MASQLLHLPSVERLSPTCIRILGGNPGKFTLQGTNTYLVGKGKSRILIDTGQGIPDWSTTLRDTLQSEDATVDKALITHWHADHQGGIRHLLEICPTASVYKNTPEAGQLEIRDGQTFSVQGATLQAVHTPGHTKDHMVFHLKEEDAIFAGDNVLGQGTVVFEDLTTYLQSLEKMRSLFSGRLYPGHGPVLIDGPSKISEYINHRRQREDQVLQTLRTRRVGGIVSQGNAWSTMEIVKVIYADIPEDLHKAAQGGVIQILEKLEREGWVVLENDKWMPKDRPTL
jgi:endoribonuclease LACTB2